MAAILDLQSAGGESVAALLGGPFHRSVETQRCLLARVRGLGRARDRPPPYGAVLHRLERARYERSEKKRRPAHCGKDHECCEIAPAVERVAFTLLKQARR